MTAPAPKTRTVRKPDPELGHVMRKVREGEVIEFHLDGRSIGFIEFVRIPNDAAIRVCLGLRRDVRIVRKEEP